MNAMEISYLIINNKTTNKELPQANVCVVLYLQVYQFAI